MLKRLTSIPAVFFIINVIIILSFSYFFFFYKISNKDLWYKDTNFIGHALYGIDNNDYTNSYEALEEGYQKGIRVMERMLKK